ncbi:ROK family protein [Actinoplanes sp. HUAS TT8]|uniref:ROK family protein n=1 Tax=Actinoplanes sp. HUAS TT8 TaxID=3447453 RepID=UPI003F525A63
MTTRSTELLRVVHRSPGVTRADAARLLGIGTGAATELVTKLSRAALLIQGPAAPSGTRGRPTTVLLPHPAGPLALAVAITHETWRVEVVELGGTSPAFLEGRHAGAAWVEVHAAVRAAIKDIRLRYGDRVRAVGVSVPGTVARDLRLDAVGPGWHDVDLTALAPDAEVFVAGNDATLAATAESRRGAAVDAAVALHLRIEAGLGGAVVEDGRPVIGARGAAGEFGHMPFGDPSIRCPCGARGCWGIAVDGHELARLLGDPTPLDTLTYARRVITTAASLLAGMPSAGPSAPPPGTPTTPPPGGSSASTPPPGESSAPTLAPGGSSLSASAQPVIAAVRAVAANLGRGIAGLVNGLDADLVTLGGLGTDLLATVPDEIHAAYRDGLMSIHRESPPPIVPAALGDAGPIAGAAEEAWSALLPRLA